MFSYIDLEARVRRDHPLRAIREIANVALEALSADFAALLLADGPALDRAGAAVASAPEFRTGRYFTDRSGGM